MHAASSIKQLHHRPAHRDRIARHCRPDSAPHHLPPERADGASAPRCDRCKSAAGSCARAPRRRGGRECARCRRQLPALARAPHPVGARCPRGAARAAAPRRPSQLLASRCEHAPSRGAPSSSPARATAAACPFGWVAPRRAVRRRATHRRAGCLLRCNSPASRPRMASATRPSSTCGARSPQHS